MKTRARLAGVFYLLTIVCGVFAEVYVRASVVFRGDAAATARNVVDHEVLYRAGLAADLVMLACYVVVTMLFYELFLAGGATVSRIAVLFSAIGIAELAANSLNHVAPLLDPSLALVALRLHGRGYVISGVFFGTYCVLIGWLIVRSRAVPAALGVLFAIGGLAYLVSSFVAILVPAARIPDLGIVGGVAELVLSLWLIAMGARS